MHAEDRSRRSHVGARAFLVALGCIILAAATAHAAELNTAAELDGSANEVTVQQGRTQAFTISLWAVGTIRCTATQSNPARAKVDTSYHLDATGTPSSSSLSDPVPFYADPFCDVTWPGDPTPQTVTASISAASTTPVGDYSVDLHTVVTTPTGSGSSLHDTTPTTLTIHVVTGSDSTPPVVSCDSPAGTAGLNGWYTSEITVDCTSSDVGSGLADAADGSFTLATTADGAAWTPSRTVYDVAGNGATVGPFGPFKIDTIAPAITCASPSGTAGSAGWYTSAVSVACSSSDATSGLAVASDAAFTLSAVGDGSRSIAPRTVTDVAGNATTTQAYGPFSIDTVAPAVACSDPSGSAGSNGWYTSDVSVTCTASDATSGLSSSSDASFTMSTTGEGIRSIDARSVSDVASNTTATPGYGPFSIDLVDPTASLSPLDGSVFVLGSSVTATYSCSDTADGSGIATCTGTVPNDGSLDTGSVGTKSVSVTATDNAGRTSTVTHSYSVIYVFSMQPQTGQGRDNVRAGSAMPVWFSIAGVSDTHSISGITSTAVSCSSTAAAPLGPAVVMAGSGVTYDASTGRFSFVWKTDKAWAGTCRQLQVALNDGTVHTMVIEIR